MTGGIMFRGPLTALGDPDDLLNESWDNDGRPTVSFFGNAVQVWAALQEKPVTVNDTALIFNATPEVVRQAVNAHPWLFLNGDVIEHEGED